MKKYELTNDTIEIYNQTLYRIKALKDFSNVKSGDLGGYISGEHNLSHEGDSWVYDNALVYDNAHVYEDAQICNNAQVYGDARVYGNAQVFHNAWVYDNACIGTNAKISANEDYTVIQGFGTEYRPTTFYRCLDSKIRVKCGCFSGTIDEFRERVKTTREGYIVDEYLMIADLMELHFNNVSKE